MFYGKVSLRTDASLSKISLIQGKKIVQLTRTVIKSSAIDEKRK